MISSPDLARSIGNSTAAALYIYTPQTIMSDHEFIPIVPRNDHAIALFGPIGRDVAIALRNDREWARHGVACSHYVLALCKLALCRYSTEQSYKEPRSNPFVPLNLSSFIKHQSRARYILIDQSTRQWCRFRTRICGTIRRSNITPVDCC
jgi:hypothetical protein